MPEDLSFDTNEITFDVMFHSVTATLEGTFGFSLHVQTSVPQPNVEDNWIITAPRLFATPELALAMAKKFVEYHKITGKLPPMDQEESYLDPIPGTNQVIWTSWLDLEDTNETKPNPTG